MGHGLSSNPVRVVLVPARKIIIMFYILYILSNIRSPVYDHFALNRLSTDNIHPANLPLVSIKFCKLI